MRSDRRLGEGTATRLLCLPAWGDALPIPCLVSLPENHKLAPQITTYILRPCPEENNSDAYTVDRMECFGAAQAAVKHFTAL